MAGCGVPAAPGSSPLLMEQLCSSCTLAVSSGCPGLSQNRAVGEGSRGVPSHGAFRALTPATPHTALLLVVNCDFTSSSASFWCPNLLLADS